MIVARQTFGASAVDGLSAVATGRRHDLFRQDVEAKAGEIAAAVSGRRVLVVGGAGSIGAATVREMVAFRPKCLHVVDHDENGLAELVRDLRGDQEVPSVPDFRALPLDFGSPVMGRLLRENPPYDVVLNFAAIKHVRSEKDIWSLLQMVDTNLVKPVRLMEWMAERSRASRYFCVSTDKAANPINAMGATKRAMEHAIWASEPGIRCADVVTSARFANVSFSNGSLLQAFLLRLAKRQPLAVPRGARRFFVSVRESGWICLLAALCAPHRHILIPRMDSLGIQRDLVDIAMAVVRAHGFEPATYQDPVEARAMVSSDMLKGRYPVLLTPLDTTGEKEAEEFFGPGEVPVEVGMNDLQAIVYAGSTNLRLATALGRMAEVVADGARPTTKQEVLDLFRAIVPEMRHVETGRYLDDRM